MYKFHSYTGCGENIKIQDNSNKEFLLGKLYQDKSTSYKIMVSITFGLLGFALNFFPVDFVFYGSYRMSFLFGLIFPMLITLAWGWKYGLLHSKTIRKFLGLRETLTDPRVYYLFLNILILAVMLTLILLGERFLWNNWQDEFKNMARITGSLLLLVAGAFCLYGAAGEFVRRKIEGVIERERDQLEEIVRERTNELQENQTKLIQMVRGSTMPIIVIDKDHIVTHWNRACESLTGIPADEIIGTGKQWSAFYEEERPILADIVIEDSPDSEISRYYGDNCRKSVLIDRAYEAECFFPKLGKNGKWLDFSAAVLHDSQGNITGAIETFQDFTDRKQAEENLKRAHDELEVRVEERTSDLHASNKELEAFSYSVSHDLRAPLRSIDGFSKLLLEECGDTLTEQGIHYLERVRAGAQNMGVLIDDMLTLSRLGREPLKTETVNLTAMAEEARELLRDEWKDREVDFTFHDCPVVSADSNLLMIVLVNLLSNALKFSRSTDSAIIEFGHRVMENQIAFFLKDNGIGFNMKYADRIFAPFQRLHRSEDYEGSGIGLANVKRIIDRHGGRIWVESASDSGTTVFFTL